MGGISGISVRLGTGFLCPSPNCPSLFSPATYTLPSSVTIDISEDPHVALDGDVILELGGKLVTNAGSQTIADAPTDSPCNKHPDLFVPHVYNDNGGDEELCTLAVELKHLIGAVVDDLVLIRLRHAACCF
jgi:hypothetical protein